MNHGTKGLLVLLVVIGCQPETDGKLSRSTHPYRVPAFEDSAAFDKLSALGSVVRQVFQDYLEKENAPSVTYAVVAGDQTVISGAAGFAIVENKTEASTKSYYRIASMSKSFTAMAILKLRDEGRLSLTDPVQKYIPEFISAGSLTADASTVSVFNLLTMSAGFPEDNPSGDWQLDDTEADLMAMLGKGLSFSNVPGVRFEYSNLGYILLGMLITRVSGVSYQQYMTENILRPLGMNDTNWEYATLDEDRLALGYHREDDLWMRVELLHDGVGGAMGGMITTMDDFTKYMRFHLSAWPPRDTPDEGPVKRSSLREMHQCWRFNGLFPENRTRSGVHCPSVTGYGFGLGWRSDCNGLTRISHTGGLPGYGSIWAMYPEYGIAVAAFSNQTYGAPSRPSLVALDTLIYLASLKPRKLPASEILKSRSAQLMDVISSWPGTDSALFAENFFIDRSLQSWRKHCGKIFQMTGPILDTGVVVPENQLRGTFVLRGEWASAYVYFTLTPDASARIQELEVGIQEGPL